MNKSLGQVFTPKKIAEMMVSEFNLSKAACILDPCFGEGIFLKALLDSNFSNVVGIELDAKLYKQNLCSNNRLNLYNEDFLNFQKKKKFDGIIINPPYVRQEEIDKLKHYGINKAILQDRFQKYNLPSTSNLYAYFLVRCAELLKKNGELVAIIPTTWNKSRTGRQLEEILLNRMKIVKVINLSSNVFGSNVLVDVDIIKFVKKSSKKVVNADVVSRNHVKLSTIAKIRRGIGTGDNKIFVTDVMKKTFNREYYTKMISTPKQIKSFYTSDSNYDMLLDIKEEYDSLTDDIKEYLGNSKKKKDKSDWFKINKFDCSGVIFGYIIREKTKFILNDAKYYVRDNFYIIKPERDQEYLLLGLLNNYYVFNFLEKTGKRYGNGVLKLQKYDMDEIPIINPQIISSADIKKIIHEAKKMNKESIKIFTEILSKYENKTYESIYAEYEKKCKERGGAYDEN